jgi:hypothetical protein
MALDPIILSSDGVKVLHAFQYVKRATKVVRIKGGIFVAPQSRWYHPSIVRVNGWYRIVDGEAIQLEQGANLEVITPRRRFVYKPDGMVMIYDRAGNVLRAGVTGRMNAHFAFTILCAPSKLAQSLSGSVK